ncbi:hypothetical protein ACQFN5_17130 [Klebsiella sp. WOUb02]|uniref:hypothetical protein n=1 Tax=Klebsiella sp. WOUb02 TaxID=3161071 RepID=UPI003D01AE34
MFYMLNKIADYTDNVVGNLSADLRVEPYQSQRVNRRFFTLADGSGYLVISEPLARNVRFPSLNNDGFIYSLAVL